MKAEYGKEELLRIIDAAVEGEASPEEQAALLSAMAKDDELREWYAAAEREHSLLKAALSAGGAEPPAGLADKIAAELKNAPAPDSGEGDGVETVVLFQIKEPDAPERTARMEKRSFLVGRSTEADLKLEDTDVSRRHCVFEYREGRFHVKDLDSRNGVVINDIKVRECDIAPADVIRLGSTVLKVVQVTMDGELKGSGEITRSEELAPAWLSCVLDGEEKKFEITKDIISVGRGSEADIRVDREELSRRHFCIERVFDKFQLVDLGSTNGTLVNGTPALMEDLKDGDRIRVGSVEFVFHNPAEEKKEEEPVPMGERTIMALMPIDLKKKAGRKLDPKVLEERRARLKAMLEEREEESKLIKIIFSIAAVVIFALAVGFALVNSSSNQDDTLKYNRAQAKQAVNEVKKLVREGKYKEAIQAARSARREFPGTPEERELLGIIHLCEGKLNEIDWRRIYDQAYREFKDIKDRIDRVRDDPIALNELYREYKLWKARYHDRDQVRIRRGEKRPNFPSLIRDAVTTSFDRAIVASQAKAREKYYGEAITMLRLYKKRYAKMLSELFPERWAEYLDILDSHINQYVQEAKDEFEYNWDLVDFYVRENMMDEALKCLQVIIERLGIPEYKKLAEQKLAALRKGGRTAVPGNAAGPAKTAEADILKRFTDSESDKMILRYDFAGAVKYLQDYYEALVDDEAKARLKARLEEVRAMKAAFDWLRSTFNKGERLDFGRGLTGTVAKVDEKGITLRTEGGTVVKKWMSYKPRELAELFRKRLSRAAKPKNLFFNIAVFCLEFNMRHEALSYMTKALKADKTLKPKLDLLYARYSGKPIPEDGFIVYKGNWLTPKEFAETKLRERVLEEVARLDSKDEDVRDKARAALVQLAEQNENLVVSQLTMKLTDLLEKIKKSDVFKTLAMVDKLHEELRKRRKEALKIIFDKKIYPDENHGAVGQPIVDKAVNRVREIYETPIKGIIEADPKLKALVARARDIQECLGEIGYDAGDKMLDLDTLLDALNSKVNINTTLNPHEMRVYTYSMKIKDYNELLEIPGKRTKDEKAVVRYTNEYRLMMGLPYLRIDRLITKAARLHSWRMATKGFFAHVDPFNNTTPYQRMAKAGYSAGSGENIARGMGDAHSAFIGWYNSSGHHRNMLSSKHTEIGVGVFDNFWTQDFGAGPVKPDDEPDNQNIPDCGEKIVDSGRGNRGGKH